MPLFITDGCAERTICEVVLELTSLLFSPVNEMSQLSMKTRGMESIITRPGPRLSPNCYRYF